MGEKPTPPSLLIPETNEIMLHGDIFADVIKLRVLRLQDILDSTGGP